jgi:hypothetical protein
LLTTVVYLTCRVLPGVSTIMSYLRYLQCTDTVHVHVHVCACIIIIMCANHAFRMRLSVNIVHFMHAHSTYMCTGYFGDSE